MRRVLGWSGWCGYWLILIASYVVISSYVIKSARAHDWYIGQHNVYGNACCYGPDHAKRDCAHAPTGSITETRDGYIITLTREQMLEIRPSLKGTAAFAKVTWGISEAVHAKEAKPAQDGGYSICLAPYPRVLGTAGGPLRWVLCFFYPTNS